MNSFHTYAFPNAKSIIVCGDIHGEFNAVIYKLCIQYQMTELLPETIQEGHGRHFLCNSFRSFPTIPSTAPPEPSHRPCLKTELLPETMQEGHGRHSLCNSFRSFPPNTFGEDATSETRRRQRGPDTRRRRGGSSGEPRL